MIWTKIKQELLIILEDLNSKHKTIKFEHTISHNRISFLDTLVYIYIYIYIYREREREREREGEKNNTLQTTL